MIKNTQIQLYDLLKKLSLSAENENYIKQINLLLEDLKKIPEKHFSPEFKMSEEVAKIILNETGAGIYAVITAVLYIFYTAESSFKNTVKHYNATVNKLFAGLTNVPEIKSEKTEKQTDNFIKLLLTVTGDVRVILILISVQIYKMRHIDSCNEEQKMQILALTKNIYIPLTHRIGLYNIKTELEEIHMKHTETEMYRFIAGKLKETKRSRDEYIRQFIEPVKKKLDDAGYHFTIKGRPKSIHSIWNKMKTQNVTFEEVYDLFAIRIILKSDIKNEKTVCWNVYSIITDMYKPNPKRLRDWISAPKLSGYESLHTTVLGPGNKWVEVQIRTERMDEIAEKGPAAHWRYKTGKEGESSDWLAKIREEIENPSGAEDADGAKTSLYSDDILVFTPENDLKSLKKGYTILDFAFAIHSKIGETCTGGIVNGKIQPLSYELKNGDTVKVLTNKNKKPNPEWLDIAKGAKTKLKIKRALKSVAFDAADTGKDLLKEKLERLKIEFNDAAVQKITDFFNCNSAVELFHKIGKGSVDLMKIKQALDSGKENEKETEESAVREKIEEYTEEVSGSGDFLVIGNNLSGIDYKLAKCCNPLPGDKIFGFVTVNKGTKIHKANCPNAKEMRSKFPYRIIKARWNNSSENSVFSAVIFVEGNDKNGLASEITRVITEEFKLKILNISLKTDENGNFGGIVSVTVKNRDILDYLIKRLRMIKGIKYAAGKNK